MEQNQEESAKNRKLRTMELTGGLGALVGGSGILLMGYPTFLRHWQNYSDLDRSTIAADLIIGVPAAGAILCGGYFLINSLHHLYRSPRNSP